MTMQSVLVDAGDAAEGSTGVTYAAGISASSAGAIEPAVAVLARTDPDELEDVTELPELDALPHL
jgi:uncharacterized RmlC-like cupin family protein